MTISFFLDLPVDLLIDILTILDPNDIITTRKTCKILAELGRRRSVWISAYRRVSEPNGLLASSYPFEDMTVADLEFSSTATARFLARVRRKPEDSSGHLKYASERRLTHPDPDEAFINHALVPGGAVR
ncbi:hypothetical protein HWV62_35406 [Athelia sp. TMB]|nr:hypothetical protein HWV62_35406 [Athelia sp. TMB]